MTPKHRRMNIHMRILRMKSKIVNKTLTSSIQSPSMTVLTLGLLPIMSARQLIRASRHGSTRDYCCHLIVLAPETR